MELVVLIARREELIAHSLAKSLLLAKLLIMWV